jgi:hypothetical protein
MREPYLDEGFLGLSSVFQTHGWLLGERFGLAQTGYMTHHSQ